jgi:SAM-dependent methyltransferase
MSKRIERPSVREGYDRWAETYDGTANPIVALDRRYTLDALDIRPGERVLDAGCGTGAYLVPLCDAGAHAVGLDFSRGMLAVATQKAPRAALARADLNKTFPVRAGAFDAVLSALVSEHPTDLETFFVESFAALRAGGRLVFSSFHPDLARAGAEANFERDGTEYRLGAELHTTDDYLERIADAGFERLRWREYSGDDRLREEIPNAEKYIGRRLLLIICAERPTVDEGTMHAGPTER